MPKYMMFRDSKEIGIVETSEDTMSRLALTAYPYWAFERIHDLEAAPSEYATNVLATMKHIIFNKPTASE